MLFGFGACETTKLNLTQDPNALTPGQASTDLFLNKVQEDMGRLIAELEEQASQPTRIVALTSRDYQNSYSPTTFNTDWQTAYQGILQDISLMNPLAEEAGQLYHIGMGQVFSAYTMVTLVDLFGDIPMTEALQGQEGTFNPNVDPGAAVYAAAITLLDQAIANFQATGVASEPAVDLFYGGDWAKWVKAANSLKLKMYVTTRLVDPNAAAAFDAIIQGGDFISTNDEDFQFPWGSSLNNPVTRHPNFLSDYTPSGANIYQSNWLMGYMLQGKMNNGNTTFEGSDPRLKYYFYRQVDSVPQDQPNLINCVAETAPDHYPDGTIFCSLPSGYWGRDHGDDAGTPPDGQLRTAFGLYPIGGRFDDNTFAPIVSVDGGANGAGITPFLLASWVDMMRAEMALVAGNSAGARGFLVDGVSKSFAKVRSFISRDPGAITDSVPSTTIDAEYLDELGQLFDAADVNGQMDLLGQEYFVTLFGNGLDGFNFYRRTGRPSTLQPNLEPDPGTFYRSFVYPGVFVERNTNVSQKPDILVPVFWDNGVTPLAN